MSDLIQNTRESIYNRLELLFKLVEKLQLENRKFEIKVEMLEKQCQEKDNEIESLNKVSIVKQLDKQLKRRNSQINILEKQLELSKKRCKNLENKKTNNIELDITEEPTQKDNNVIEVVEEIPESNEETVEDLAETNEEPVENLPENENEENDNSTEEDEEEEEEEEDELSLVKKKIKKVYYYLDINTNNVYEIADDDELGDLLGVYDKKKRKIIKS